MNRLSPNTRLIASLLVGGIGLVLFFTGLYRDVNLPLGLIGSVVFTAAVWFAVSAIHTTPSSEAEQRVAPGEWKAWVDSAFLLAILVAMVSGFEAYRSHAPIIGNPEAAGFGRDIAGIFIAWLIVGHLLRKRWGAVISDERDTLIQLKTTQLSLYMLVCGLIAFAVGLSANPLERLQWLSYALVAHILIVLMLLAHLIGNIAQIVYYVRDRRGSAA